jgi:NarL family two-component system response regulator LiaR
MSLLKSFSGYKQVLLYGLSLAAILFLLQWLHYKFLLIDHAYEVYIFFIAVIFTTLGIWLAMKLAKPKVETRIETVVLEKQVFINETAGNDFILNEVALTALGLSSRELEVLNLMAEGLSNQEIADRLYVSLNTIKTHSSRLFEKMEVKRRTQAIEKAKRLNIIS